MPAKKASKLKRKSSSSTLTKYSRSRPLGPELKMVRRKYAKLYCWLRLSYANPSSTLSLLALDRTSVSVVPSWSKKSKSRSTCKQLGPMSEPQSLPAAGISYRVDLILGQASKRGRCPLSRHLRHTRCRCISRKSVHELAQQ